MADLLLLDREKHPGKAIHIKGQAETLQQAYLLVAALRVQARLAGIELKSEEVVVTIPGWTNWRGSDRSSIATVKEYEELIENLINRHHAQNELKDKMRSLRDREIGENEPIHPPKKH